MTEPKDVVIVGGGIVGLSTGIACAERGLKVTVCDLGEARRRTSYGNAGVISRGSLFPLASPDVWKSLLRYAGNRDAGLRVDWLNAWRIAPWLFVFLKSANEAAWRRAAAALDPLTAAAFGEHMRLAACCGAASLIARNGWMKLYRTEADFAASALERAILAEHRVEAVVLDADELKRIEPALVRPFARAVLFPQTGAVADPGGLIEAYARLLRELGADIVNARVEALAPGGAGWIVRTAAGELRAKQAVLAAGAWSDRLARSLGYRLPLAAERGYHRQFAPGDGPPLSRPVYDTGGGYIVSPMVDRLRVLSGVELAPRGAAPNYAQITRATAQAAQTLALGPTIDNEPWLGSRPSTPDGLPVIGPAPRHRGLFFAFGHGHIGLSTGPATGAATADLLIGRTPAIPVAPFSAERFL
jgi:D-amino-acid dehydrogenase